MLKEEDFLHQVVSTQQSRKLRKHKCSNQPHQPLSEFWWSRFNGVWVKPQTATPPKGVWRGEGRGGHNSSEEAGESRWRREHARTLIFGTRLPLWDKQDYWTFISGWRFDLDVKVSRVSAELPNIRLKEPPKSITVLRLINVSDLNCKKTFILINAHFQKPGLLMEKSCK